MYLHFLVFCCKFYSCLNVVGATHIRLKYDLFLNIYSWSRAPSLLVVKVSDCWSVGPSLRTGLSEWMYTSVILDADNYRNLPRVTELDLGICRFSKISLSHFLGYSSWLPCMLTARNMESSLDSSGHWHQRFERTMSRDMATIPPDRNSKPPDGWFRISPIPDPSHTSLPEDRGNKKNEWMITISWDNNIHDDNISR